MDRSGDPLPLLCMALCLALGAWIPARADDWPRYRGLLGNGFSAETSWQKSGKPRVLWRTKLGLGYSCIAVAEGRAYATGHDGRQTDTLYCLEALTGKELWRHAYSQPLGDRYFQGGTTATPAIWDGKVYQIARSGEIFCLDAQTKALIWSTHLVTQLGLEAPEWGFSGCPLVRGNLLLLNAGDGGLALNLRDGSPAWTSGGGPAGYSSPLLFSREGKDFALFSNKRGWVCADPDSGKERWRYKWLTRYGVNAADPIPSGNLIFLSSGYDKGAALLKWTGSGEPETLWTSRDMRTQMNPCILHEGHLYGIDGNEGQDRTGLKCLEMQTGQVQWLREEVGHGALIAADGHLLVLTEQGELLVAPISPRGFEPTLRLQILEGRCWTQPTLAGGLLLARNDKGAAVCLDLRNGKSGSLSLSSAIPSDGGFHSPGEESASSSRQGLSP